MQPVNKTAPQKRATVRRLTHSLKNLQPNQHQAVKIDKQTCKALREYAYSQGWSVTQQTQPDGSILLWRLA